MAGLILVGPDDSLTLEDLYRRGKGRRDPIITAFEKELNFILRVIPSRGRSLSHELNLKLSNSLFSLWNNYQGKLPLEYFTEQLLRVADLLYEAGLYSLARTHGYRKCLMTGGLLLGDRRNSSEALEQYVSSGNRSEKMVLALIRCEIGDAMCVYFTATEKDTKLIEQSTRAVVTSVLARLHTVCQLSLLREDRYWLAHNGFQYIFSLCRKMVAHSHVVPTMEHLIWSVVAMESSVPLLATKYLKIRTNFYVLITQCYNLLDYHNEAEVFARRALDKVNELAQLEHQSSSKPTPGSDLIFKEATIKLEVLVFKRAVFVSHKKTKFPFKFKFHPSVKNLLQLTPPRTTTEKLLGEMFSSATAQFVAILETLTDMSRRSLDRGPPPTIANIEQETMADVYMELFTAGVDLCLATLTARPHSQSSRSGMASIMESAVKGKSHIPLLAMVKFIRVAHIYEQKDVMEILGEKVIEAAQESSDPLMVARGKALQLMIAMELLLEVNRRILSGKDGTNKRGASAAGRGSASGGRGSLSLRDGSASVRMPTSPRGGKGEGDGGPAGKGGKAAGKGEMGPDGGGRKGEGASPKGGRKMDGEAVSPKAGGKGEDKETRKATGKKRAAKEEGEGGATTEGGGSKNNEESPTSSPAEELHDVLVKVTHFLHFTIQSTPALLEVDFDLLHDSLVACWEVLRPALSSINTHNYRTCKVFLTNPIGLQYMQLLTELVAIAHTLELWRVDSLLHGELCLKLCCLLECQAENRGEVPPTVDGKLVTFLGYHRSQLLTCRRELESTLAFIKLAQQKEGRRREGRVRGSEQEDSCSSLSLLHVECVYDLTRVQVKLASTIPPSDFFESQGKPPSSLKSKVNEREQRQQQRNKLLRQLSSLDVAVLDIAKLKAECGRNHYQQALLLMLQATTMPGLTPAEKHKLMEESYACLVLEEQWCADSSAGPTKPGSSSLLPPPVLLSATETSMEFSLPPLDPEMSKQVAYYRLFGRVASGSCVKVREADKLFPGLGMEVPCEVDCRLMVRGLQPNEDYVFAVAGYTSGGKLVGKAIGQTSRPYRTTFSLPLLTAWAYCCQCAYTVGSKAVALKCCKILWQFFVTESNKSTVDTKLQSSPKSQSYRLKECAHNPALTTHLHLFILSIFIYTDLTLDSEGLWMDRLSTSGPLLPQQQRRLDLARKLLVGVEVGGLLNDPQLCLQLVVRCYGILTPLMQHRVPSRAAVEMLIHCFTVLLELPGGLLNTKFPGVTVTIHHMVAAIAFYVGKTLLSWNHKPLFSRFTESCRAVLLLTMSEAVAAYKAPPISLKTSSPDPLTQGPCFLLATQDTTTSSYATLTANPLTRLTAGPSTKKKRSRKKVHLFPDHISDENKTQQFKALEAFVMKYQHQADDVDLGGGEDPIVLHHVISTCPSIAAHKELIKFKRRPQYLEMLVHLVTVTIAKGHHDRVMEWLAEGFQWLGRRNEVLLNPRKQVSEQPSTGGKGKLAKTSHLFSAVPSKVDLKKSFHKRFQTAGGSPGSTKAAGSAGGKQGSKDQATGGYDQGLKCPQTDLSLSSKSKKTSSLASARAAATAVAKREPVLSGGREFYLRNSMRMSLAAELSTQIKITKEDLETKSVFVLITKLPDMWRTHKTRKRLRSVCTEELPWRAQANLVYASCYLNQVLGRLRSEKSESIEESLQGGKLPRNGLGFESVGLIIDGVIPSFPEAMAGMGRKVPAQPSLVDSKSKMSTASSHSTVNPTVYSSNQTLVLSDIRTVMTCHVRAAVLAVRGRLWTLLQNVARSLWNAINSLALAVSELGKERSDYLTASVHGLARRALYAVGDGLVELLGDCDQGATSLLSQTSSLTFTPGLDDTNGVGMAAIKQMVFLALHVLYVNQHWEKVLALGLDFDDVTNHSWADQLVPLLSSAQTRLADRIATHKNTERLQSARLEPAAHLDPGPKGYDIYGGVGFSLSSVPKVYLDRGEVKKRVGLMCVKAGPDSDKLTSQHVLVECRRLFKRYTASAALGESPVHVYSDGLAASALNKAQLPLIVAAYNKAVRLFLGSNENDLAIQAMNELGDVMMLSGDTKLAKQWWLDGLTAVLGVKNPLATWRKVTPITLKGCGLWGCLLGAMMAIKLLRYVYWKHLDVRIECALLAASFMKTVLVGYTMPYPTTDMAYANYDHAHSIGGGAPTLFPGTDLFTDPFRCSPSYLLFALRWCSLELINRGYAKRALPILWLYNHVAIVDCRAVQEAVTAKILRLRVLTQLNLFSAAMQQLQELLNGGGLPQDSTHCSRQPESSMSFPKFQDHLPLSDSANSKVLYAVLDRQLKPHLETAYGNVNVTKLAVARALLYVSLVHTHSGSPQPSGTSFGLASPSPAQVLPQQSPQQPAHLSTLSLPQLAADSPTMSSRPSTRESLLHPPIPSPTRKSKANIKTALVCAAERILALLTLQKEGDHSWESADVRVCALLGLAQLAVVLQHSVSGYQLSLQALRMLQALEEGGAGGVASNLRELDLYLWMECRFWMVRSVVGLEAIPGGGGLLLEVGEHCEECGKHGEVVLVAEMMLAAAEHAMTMLPCQLKAAQQHSQRCVEILNSLPELSHKAQMISSKATLVLADTTCIRGIDHTPSNDDMDMGEQIAEVFAGLIKTMKKQIDEEQISPGSGINIYQPRYSLLASVLLRLGHTHILMAGRPTTDPIDRSNLLSKAQECFKEGLDIIHDSTHFDPCLSCELLFANGWCMAALPLYFKLEESIAVLVKGGKMVMDSGVDYRLASTFLLTLAELYSKKRSKPPTTRRSDRRMSMLADPDKTAGSEVKGGWEQGAKDCYLAWCMVRSAVKVTSSRQALQCFASTTSTADMTKPLSDRVLQDLPDFVLLDLYPQCKSLETLANKPILLPVASLLLSRQFRPKVMLNWFKVISYYNRLIQRCSWQKVSLGFPDSDWGLHYNHTSPLMYAKAKAVHGFLCSHYLPFKSCIIPALPQPSMLPSGPAVSSSSKEPHLVTGEMDTTIIWYATPVPSVLLKKMVTDSVEVLPASDRVTGYFAMNLKSVNFPIHCEPHVLGMETHVVHTSLKRLSALHDGWKEVEKSVAVYLDSKPSLRPISRSPSKQKRAEKNIQPPEELMKDIAEAVKKVADFFDSKAKELPRIEPHAVPSLTKVLEPFTRMNLKGDAYFFLREILSHKQ